MWDLTGSWSIRQLINEIGGTGTGFAFNPDGKMLAAGSCAKVSLGFCLQGEIILWDMVNRQPLGNPLIVNGNTVYEVVFSADGSTLATGSGGIILWEMDPKAWAKSNCQRAGRNFTRAEWTQYFPNDDYPATREEATCPQWLLELEVTATVTPAP